ncbi:hypothetical protein FRC10_005441, partial [Ceratobasidium sp. 414]
MELVLNAEFESIFDTLVSALEEMKDQLGGESEVEGEAAEVGGPEARPEMEGLEAEMEGPEAEMERPEAETNRPEAEMEGSEAEMEMEVDPQTPVPRRTDPGEQSMPRSDIEAAAPPQRERTPAATPCSPQGTSKCRQRLLFDKKENAFVEHFPDPRAGTPINDKTTPTPNLNEYIAAAGNLGIPRHLDTTELLLTTGLTARGRDEHLQSHLYVGNTPWRDNKVLTEDHDKLPHGPGWEVYKIVTKMAGQANKKSYLFTRNIVEVALDIMANPAFKDHMCYTPQHHWTTADRQSRVYDNLWSANWWWRTQ